MVIPGGKTGCKDYDVKKNTECVDGEAEEDAVLVVLVNNAPNKSEEEEDVVDEDRLARPVAQAGPRDEDKVTQEQSLELQFRNFRPLKLYLLIAHD